MSAKGYRLNTPRVLTFLLVASLLDPSRTRAQDVYGTQRALPAEAGAPLFKGPPPSLQAISAQPLELKDAVDCALSYDPKTSEQWANIKVQAASLGIGYAAFLPTLTGSLQGTRQQSTTTVENAPAFNSDSWANTNSESVSLSWVLYDFGGRAGALRNARELRRAAEASYEATLRTVFATVTKDYYAAQAAEGTLETTQENEKTTKQSYEVAWRRVAKGVAPISDQLQANTAYCQAQVDATKAQGEYEIAVGTLASDMGLGPDARLILPKVDPGHAPDKEFEGSVSLLISEAIRQHPSVRAAEAQYQAALAKVRQIRAQGLPVLSLVAKSQRSAEPLNAEVGVSPFNATETQNYAGFQLTVPIFDGFLNDYQIRQALAQVEVQRFAVQEAQQQIGLELWTSYQLVQATTKNLRNTAGLVYVAQRAFTASQSRYENGVGDILERLDTQSALASAKLQWIKAWTDWNTSRLQLASKLGAIEMRAAGGLR